MSLNWLEKMKISVTFYLLQTDQLVTKINGLLILNIHSTSVSRKMLSSYTSVQGREVFMENSATSKVNGEGTIQFRSHDECITTLQGIYYVSELRYNLISHRALQGKWFTFSFEGDLMKVFKEAHVKFQAERVGNVYKL